MNVTVIVQPPFEPLTMAQAYAHLRLDPEGSPLAHPEDALVAEAIAGARSLVEGYTHRSLVQRTLRLSAAGFPGQWDAAAQRALGPVRLLRPPVVRVLSVQYFDASNALQTVSPADHYVTDEDLPQLRFVTGFSAPAVYDRPDAVRVEYVAGYAAAGSPPTTQADYVAALPADIVAALKLQLGDLYENRETQQAMALQVNTTARALLYHHVVPVIA